MDYNKYKKYTKQRTINKLYMSAIKDIKKQREDLEFQQEKLQVKMMYEEAVLEKKKTALLLQEVELSRKVMLLEVKEKELFFENKLIELTKITIQHQLDVRSFEIQQKEVEVLGLISDYEMKKRELDVLVGERTLLLEEKNLELKSTELNQRITQAEIDINRNRSLNEIDRRMIDVSQSELNLNRQSLDMTQREMDINNRIREAEINLSREGSLLQIQERLNQLRGTEFEQQAKELLFRLEVGDREADLNHRDRMLQYRNQEFNNIQSMFDIDMQRREHDMSINENNLNMRHREEELFAQQNQLNIDRAMNDITRRENELTQRSFEGREARDRLIYNLEMERHRALNAQNNLSYVNSAKGSLLNKLMFLWVNRSSRMNNRRLLH